MPQFMQVQDSALQANPPSCSSSWPSSQHIN